MITKLFGSIAFDLFILLLVAIGCAVWEHYEAAKYKASIEIYQIAQKTNLATISSLEQTAKNTQAQLQGKIALAAQYAAAAHAATDRANAALAQRTTDRKVIYETPTVAPWANTVAPDPVLVGLCRGSRCPNEASP
jgi:ribosomal protein S10